MRLPYLIAFTTMDLAGENRRHTSEPTLSLRPFATFAP
jgi:hypothetical protein